MLIPPFKGTEPITFRNTSRKDRGILRRKGIYFPYDLHSADIKTICNHPLLSREEEQKLGERIQQGDEEALDTLISHNLRLVVSCSKQFVTTRISLGDAVNIGVVGLIKAAKRFDPSRGVKFSTYASWWIRQAIRLAFWHSRSALIHVPHSNRGLAHKKAQGEKLTEFEEHTLDLTLKAQGVTNDVYNLPQSIEPAVDESYVSESLIREEAISGLRRAFERLLPKDQYLLGMRFGMGKFDKPLSLKKIGDIEGLSQEAVRQREKKAMARLRAILEEEGAE